MNGTGKSSILAAINYLCWNWVNRLNPSQGTAFKSMDASLVRSGSSKLEISTELELGENPFTSKKEYIKARPGKGASVASHKKLYDAFIDRFMHMYGADDVPMPIFVNYGTNRSVLDIPLRIRKKHQFSKWAAFERALENRIGLPYFFSSGFAIRRITRQSWFVSIKIFVYRCFFAMCAQGRAGDDT